MSSIDSELSIKNQIQTVMSYYPDWVFVREVLDTFYNPKPDDLSTIVTKSVIEFPNIDLFFATIKPTYSEEKINALSKMPAADLIDHLDGDRKKPFQGEHTNYEAYPGYYWGILSFKETLGSLKQSLSNEVTASNPYTSKILEDYGFRNGDEQNKSELTRSISVHFMLSIPLAEFIATSWEMYSIRDKKKRQFRVLPDAWGKVYTIPIEDIYGIIHDENYLQKIASRSLEGYIIPGLI